MWVCNKNVSTTYIHVYIPNIERKGCNLVKLLALCVHTHMYIFTQLSMYAGRHCQMPDPSLSTDLTNLTTCNAKTKKNQNCTTLEIMIDQKKTHFTFGNVNKGKPKNIIMEYRSTKEKKIIETLTVLISVENLVLWSTHTNMV